MGETQQQQFGSWKSRGVWSDSLGTVGKLNPKPTVGEADKQLYILWTRQKPLDFTLKVACGNGEESEGGGKGRRTGKKSQLLGN